MRRDRAEHKIKELLEDSKEMIWDKVQKALNSGALDIDSFGDDYVLPKIVVSAVFSEMAYQYAPLGTQNEKEIKNLKKFL